MTAIAGIVDFGSSIEAAEACRAILLAQQEYGPHGLDCGTDGAAFFGRALFKRFPEDQHDRQPVRGAAHSLLVADVRIDNRDELCRSLNIDRVEARSLADSAIVSRLWERWGDAMFDHLAGAFAIALWDGERRRLVLARDPFGQSPLHFAVGAGWVAFASMPQALRSMSEIDGSPDPTSLAAFVADLPRRGRSSFFRGIERIEPGHAMSITAAGTRYWRHWNPEGETRLSGLPDYIEAFRFHLDQAVESCLRGAKDTVASHLSGGWDSAAVTASAALQLAPSARLLAFTAAPPTEFAGAVPAGRIADESGRAALVARSHANIEHRVIRNRGERPIALLAQNNRFLGEPTGYVCNNMWWTAINRAASNHASILLTAEMGNHTLSAGGAMQLADLVRTGAVGPWLRESRRLATQGTLRWTGILDQSFGPFVPFYSRVRPWLTGSGHKSGAIDLVAQALRPAVVRLASEHRCPARPADSRSHRLALLGEHDNGPSRKASLARWGLDERDPTTERRFVEFCLSLPREALLRDGIARPVARAALADRVPDAIRDARERGLQFADWYCQISADEVGHELAREGSRALLDRCAVERLIADWPSDGFEKSTVVRTYRMDLMRAVSAASFLETYSRRGGDERRRQPDVKHLNVVQ